MFNLSGHQDVEDYKKELAARDRASFVFRRKEARLQRIEEQVEKDELEEIEAANNRLETLARADVEQYLLECRHRRRLSLAFRAKERRRHMKWDRQQREQERLQKNRDTRDNAMDHKVIELARQKERAQEAMDNIRHAARLSSSNPFADVLN